MKVYVVIFYEPDASHIVDIYMDKTMAESRAEGYDRQDAEEHGNWMSRGCEVEEYEVIE